MKRLFFIFLAIISHIGSFSASLTADKALQRYFSTQLMDSNIHASKRQIIRNKADLILKKEVKTKNNEPSLYIFDKGNNNGFIILSADDALTPLIGYTDFGSYEESNLPEAFQYLLDDYNRQISLLRESPLLIENLESSNHIRTDLEAIEPLIETKWGQGEPFNYLCPERNDHKCVTGCLATSMAQVMNYFKFPNCGNGTVSYRANGFDYDLTLDLSSQTFDWENMRNEYTRGDYTQTEVDAVSTLMRACGYSLKMQYSVSTSVTTCSNLVNALVENFNYDKNIKLLKRVNYSYDQWVSMLHDNLKNIGPVIYNGQPGYGVGHSFVCDGYDGEGYFHINWGWGGYCDGYFFVDLLNQENPGIGGGSGRYSAFQEVLFYIQPTRSYMYVPEMVFMSNSLSGKINENKLMLCSRISEESEIQDHLSGNVQGLNNDFELGIIVEDEAVPSETKYFKLDDRPYIDSNGWYYYSHSDINLQDLQLKCNIKYKVTLAYIHNNEWKEINAYQWDRNYFYLLYDGINYSITNGEIARLSINDFKISENLSLDIPINYSVTVSNNSDKQVSQTIGFRMFDNEGNETFISYQFSLLTLGSGEEKSIDYITTWGWKASFDKENQNYPLQLYIQPYDFQINEQFDYPIIPVTVYRYASDFLTQSINWDQQLHCNVGDKIKLKAESSDGSEVAYRYDRPNGGYVTELPIYEENGEWFAEFPEEGAAIIEAYLKDNDQCKVRKYFNVIADGDELIYVDGIYYRYTDSSKSALKVARGYEMYVGSYEIPTTVNGFPITEIGDHAFYSCRELDEVKISEGVTTISGDAFGNSALSAVYIPASVRTIEEYSLTANGGRLMDIYLYASVPVVVTEATFNGDVDYNKCRLHVPQGSIGAYRNADVWKNFANIIDDVSVGNDSGIVDVLQDHNPYVKIYSVNGNLLYEGSYNDARLERGFYIIITQSHRYKIIL